MWSFEPFRVWCATQRKGQVDVENETGISHPTVNKIWHDKVVRTDTIETICHFYQLEVEQVCKINWNIAPQPVEAKRKKTTKKKTTKKKTIKKEPV